MLDLVDARVRDRATSVTSAEPGWLGVPSSRNHAEPWRAISATCASVSALLISVGRRLTPCSKGIGGVNFGTAGPPLRWLTSADSCPET